MLSFSFMVKLLSLNAVLSEGVVIEILPETVIDDPICIYNYVSSEETLIIPYVLIIAKEKCKIKFLDLTNYIGKENWTNFFYQIYLEENSDLQMSNLGLNQFNNVNTSSYNYHAEFYHSRFLVLCGEKLIKFHLGK